MKRFYMILAAVAALALTAQAQYWESLEVGDFENAETYNGSYFDMAPTNFYIAHTGCQLLYTPDMLADFNDKFNLKIKGLSFRFYNESFDDMVRNVNIYLQETDATEFAVNEEGVKQFFPLGDQVVEEERTFFMSYLYGEDFDVSFRFDYPFTPGKGLLVTIVFDALDDDNCTMGSDYAPFYTSGIRGKAMTYTNNWTSFVDYTHGNDFPNATASLGCGTNVELPCTRIDYYYEDPVQTASPEIITTPGDEFYTFTAQVKEGDPEAEVSLYLVDENRGRVLVDNPLVVNRGELDQTLELVAVAHIENQLDGETSITAEVPAKTATGIDEIINGKAVAGVRYYNMAGQEMQEANGMTIVVTTYTDGSTTVAKVMK